MSFLFCVFLTSKLKPNFITKLNSHSQNWRNHGFGKPIIVPIVYMASESLKVVLGFIIIALLRTICVLHSINEFYRVRTACDVWDNNMCNMLLFIDFFPYKYFSRNNWRKSLKERKFLLCWSQKYILYFDMNCYDINTVLISP